MAAQVPLVDYLALEPQPHLQAHVCADCGARFLERRNACSRCGGRRFSRGELASEGTLTAYTIVNRAAPGVPVPFVAGIVQLSDGAIVAGNVVDVEPDPEHVSLGMPLRLTTYAVGADDNATEAIGFGFAPAN